MQQSGDPLRIQVFYTLEDAILNGSYKEGDSLNELRLSKESGCEPYSCAGSSDAA